MAAAGMSAATTAFTRAARSRRPHQRGHTQNQDVHPKKDASHDRSSAIFDLSLAGSTLLVIVRQPSCARLLAGRFLQGFDLGVSMQEIDLADPRRRLELKQIVGQFGIHVPAVDEGRVLRLI